MVMGRGSGSGVPVEAARVAWAASSEGTPAMVMRDRLQDPRAVERPGVAKEDFHVDWRAETVACPQGAVSPRWKPTVGRRQTSAVGAVPDLHHRDSGRRVGNLHRAKRYSRRLQRVFYTSALISIQRSPASKSCYERKRAQGKRHGQTYLLSPGAA